MKALVVRKKGVLELEESPLPRLEENRLRIRVEYTGVGFADVMAVQGGYPLAPRRPFSPGYEFLGTVQDFGNLVTGFVRGQRVAGMLPHMACYQEFLDLDPVWAVAVPPSLAPEKAAALPLNFLTASALLERAGLKPGDAFLIHGAAGGVGSAALELGRNRGFRAYGTVSAGKEADVEAFGAVPILRGESWMAQALEREPGFQAVFDSFGGSLLRQSYHAVAPGGILVSYGFSPSSRGGYRAFADGLLFHLRRRLFSGEKRTALCGVPSIIDRDRPWYRQTLAARFDEAAAGRLDPKIFKVLPWEQASEAHQLITSGQVRGKILLQFSA